MRSYCFLVTLWKPSIQSQLPIIPLKNTAACTCALYLRLQICESCEHYQLLSNLLKNTVFFVWFWRMAFAVNGG